MPLPVSSCKSTTLGLVAVLTGPLHQTRLRRILKDEGYDVRVFSLEAELIAFLADWIPDIVLIDVRFADGDYRKGYKVVRHLRTWKAQKGNSPFPAVVCLSAIWNPRQEDELRRQGTAVAWLSDRGEILRRMRYVLDMAHLKVANTPYFRITFENKGNAQELNENSTVKTVELIDDNGVPYAVALTPVRLLIFVYLLLRGDVSQGIEEMCENLNRIPLYYSSRYGVRVFTYESVKTELSRIREYLRQFLNERGFSFSNVWIEQPVDGDERTSSFRICARREIDIYKINETAQEHGFKG